MTESAVSMVERIVLILKAFEGSQAARLKLADISDLTDIPKSSTFRILQQLVDARLIEREGKEYCLGLGIFELGSLFPHRSKIVAQAKPYMQELSAGGRYVAHLAMLDGTEVVYLDKVGGRFAGQLPSRVGGRFKAHKTAVGKAILANADPLPVDAYLERVFINSQDTPGLYKFQSEMIQIRQLGFAAEHGEAVTGVSCVAASIMHGNTAIAGISICGPTEHLDIERLRSGVRMAATSISRSLNRGPNIAIA